MRNVVFRVDIAVGNDSGGSERQGCGRPATETTATGGTWTFANNNYVYVEY